MNSISQKTFKKVLSILILISGILILQGNAVSGESLKISGASTIQPFMEELSPDWQNKTGNTLEIKAGGSGAGIRDAGSGASDIGMVSRALRTEEKADLTYVTIGMDTIVFIVNERNPIKEINKRTLADLYSGRIKNWKDVSGWDAPVILVNKEIGRSTLDLFEEYSGLTHPARPSRSGTAIVRETLEIGSNLESLSLVGGIPGAVGYVSLGTASEMKAAGMPVRILPLDGVVAETRTILSGTYPIQRELNLVFLHKSPPVTSLIDEALSPSGQKRIRDMGFIPVR